MKKISRRHLLVGFFAGALLMYGVSVYIQAQQKEYVAMLKLLIAQQESTLISLAEVTDRNGADAVVDAIIKDCPLEDRQRFDLLLGTLANLSSKELVEVNQLFGACGNFFSERKALMTARLEREFEVYNSFLELIQAADTRIDPGTYPVEKWSELVDLELQRSDLSSQLVVIQKDIITALLEGVSIQSERMRTEVAKAQEVKDTLSYTGVRIDTLRNDIIGL